MGSPRGVAWAGRTERLELYTALYPENISGTFTALQGNEMRYVLVWFHIFDVTFIVTVTISDVKCRLS
jgi:hypothetical protein